VHTLGVEIVKFTPKEISLIKGFLAIPRACPQKQKEVLVLLIVFG
jgi:hypothetical protein